MRDEGALNFLIERLRKTLHAPPQARCDVDLTNIAWEFMVAHENVPAAGRTRQHEARIEELSEYFLNAAWHLARLGVLRPGKRQYAPSADAHWEGRSYTFTEFGRAWLGRPLDELVLVNPDRTAQLLGRYRQRFGAAFLQRGIEAGECYRAQLYLACVAMCGAAREAVLVALANERMDRAEVEQLYLSSGGRGRLETNVLGQLPPDVRARLKELSGSGLDPIRWTV